MSIIQKLTLAHLKKNKGRTVVTILGICVSVAMITAVFVSITSLMHYISEVDRYTSGSWEIQADDVTTSQYNKLISEDLVKQAGRKADLPAEKSGFMLDYGISARTSTGSVLAADSDFYKQMVTCDIEGELPDEPGEILVEKELIENNNLNWHVGDVVTIPIGSRIIEDDGNISTVSGGYYAGEKFELNGIEDYTICGIISENMPTRSFSVLRLATEDELETSTAYISLKEIDFSTYADARQLMNDCGISSYTMNDEYLASNFSFSANGNYMLSIIPAVAVILAVIIFASVALIYNAFGMSLSERTRYLGMLASVGATKSQKSESVYFEGFVLGLIGIPIGIGAGILGIYVTLEVVGKKIQESGMINGGENAFLSMVVPIWAIIGIIIVSAFTIFISAMIPAKKASRVTPIDALKQTNEIKLNPKKLRSSKLVRALFGYEGELANKNLKRNGRKSRVITASIALSIVLVLCTSAFCDMFVAANDLSNDVPYQVYATVGNDDDYNLIYNETKDLDTVNKVYSVTNEYLKYSDGTNAENYFTNQDIAKEENLTSSYKKFFNEGYVFVNFIDDEDFNALCEKNNIDSNKYYTLGENGEVNALLMNNIAHKSNSGKVFSDNIIGEKLYIDSLDKNGNVLPYSENNNIKAVITDFIDYDANNYVCNLNSASTASAYVPISMYVEYYNSINTDCVMLLGYETENSSALTEEIENIVDQYSLSDIGIMDMNETFKSMNTLIFVIQVFVYGFVALMTLISVFNIVNTVSTGIDLRRKEFAMFKSIGITPHGFRKMISLESLLYGIKAVIFGIPISLILTYLMYHFLQSNNLPFTINIPLYLIVIVIVFLIVGVSMFYAVSKTKKDSIVGTLKEDIC